MRNVRFSIFWTLSHNRGEKSECFLLHPFYAAVDKSVMVYIFFQCRLETNSPIRTDLLQFSDCNAINVNKNRYQMQRLCLFSSMRIAHLTCSICPKKCFAWCLLPGYVTHFSRSWVVSQISVLQKLFCTRGSRTQWGSVDSQLPEEPQEGVNFYFSYSYKPCVWENLKLDRHFILFRFLYARMYDCWIYVSFCGFHLTVSHLFPVVVHKTNILTSNSSAVLYPIMTDTKGINWDESFLNQ